MKDHMRPEDFTPGQGVVYRAHPDAQSEQGTVVRVTDFHVFVHYAGDMHGHAKATPAEMLEPIGGGTL